MVCRRATGHRTRRCAARRANRPACFRCSRVRTGPCSATKRTAPPSRPRPGLHVHIVGPRGDLVDDAGHFRDAYGLSPGEWVLVRPDGYVGAIVSADKISALERYLGKVGVAALG